MIVKFIISFIEAKRNTNTKFCMTYFFLSAKEYKCPLKTDKAKLRERKAMMKSIMTGIGVGMAVGGASAYLKGAMAGSGMKRKAKKTAHKAMKNMEELMGDVKYMFK